MRKESPGSKLSRGFTTVAERVPTGFQMSRPIRGATLCAGSILRDRRHFNPRAPYGARLSGGTVTMPAIVISIHAPHTGRDVQRRLETAAALISIHAPHTGRDSPSEIRRSVSNLFQSTRPIRGATTSSGVPFSLAIFQSTRPIRGATRRGRIWCRCPRYFNPRAPYGARPSPSSILGASAIFQSTRPIRGATSDRQAAGKG